MRQPSSARTVPVRKLACEVLNIEGSSVRKKWQEVRKKDFGGPDKAGPTGSELKIS
jgi:hypothetical protein